jgi:neutral ceramidase
MKGNNFMVNACPLAVGHARSDISPGPECSLLGYDQRLEFFPDGGNAGVHDPLFADVLVLEAGDVRAAVVSLDLCILETPFAVRMRKAVGEAAAVPPAHVVLACSHTHSGPYPWLPEWKNTEPVPGSLLDENSQLYARWLEEQLVVCSGQAASGVSPARVSLRSGSLALGYSRRVTGEGGLVRMAWNLREWNGPEPRPCDDPAFQVLRFERDKGNILLWNAAAHAVVLGKRNNSVSADWPGATRERIEELCPGISAIFLHGAGGDVHPWLATGESPDDLAVVAEPAANLVALMASAPAGLAQPESLSIRSDTIHTDSGNIELTALRIGPARLLAVPCELFGRTGAALRARFPDLLLATTANGWSGYWPPEECFQEGGHEVAAAIEMGRQPADCRLLVETGSRLLEGL